MKAIHLSDIYHLGELVATVDLEDGKLYSVDRTSYLSNLLLFKDACDALALRFTLTQVNRVEHILRGNAVSLTGLSGDVTYQALRHEVFELGRRFKEEMADAHAFSMDAKEHSLYEEPVKGWETILASFGSTLLDVEESSRCLAVGRYTATVFHAMRILESGLTVTGTAFSVPTDRDNWHIIIQNIESAIETQSKARGASWPDQQFYSEAALQFRFFKDAWRNHVMHVRLSFGPEQAEEIRSHVQRFMSQLATKLQE